MVLECKWIILPYGHQQTKLNYRIKHFLCTYFKWSLVTYLQYLHGPPVGGSSHLGIKCELNSLFIEKSLQLKFTYMNQFLTVCFSLSSAGLCWLSAGLLLRGNDSTWIATHSAPRRLRRQQQVWRRDALLYHTELIEPLKTPGPNRPSYPSPLTTPP